MAAPGTAEPATPAATPINSITVASADIPALGKAIAERVLAEVLAGAKKDFSPSVLVAGLEAIPHGLKAVVKVTNWPMLITFGVAAAALVLHFTDTIVKHL